MIFFTFLNFQKTNMVNYILTPGNFIKDCFISENKLQYTKYESLTCYHLQQKHNLQISFPSILQVELVLVQSVHILHVLSVRFVDTLPVHLSLSWVLAPSASSAGTVHAPEQCGIVWTLSCGHGTPCNIKLNLLRTL